MIIEKRVYLKSKSILIKTLDDNKLAVVDATNAIRFFSSELELIGGFKANINSIPNLFHGCDVSKDGKFVSFCVEKDGVLTFLSEKKALVYKFKRHEGDVESVCISPKFNYIATGGQDGKTFLWSLANGKMVASLPHHADFVTTIAFSQNGRWVATGSYDRKIKITNVLSLGKEITLKAHSKAITNIHFISNNRLVSSDKDGSIIVWDYFAKKMIARLQKMLNEVTSLAFTPDHKFMFASDKSGYISLYDMQNYTLISQKYIQYSQSVTRIEYMNEGNHLVVALENGELFFLSPLKEEAKIREFIEQEEYAKANELIKENPLLKYTDAYIELEAKWEETFNRALLYAESGKFDEAKKALKPFMDEPSKRLIIQKLLNDYKEFEKFKFAATSKKYPLAYSIVNQYPALKESRYYLAMEDEWKKVFEQAKKIILKSKGEDEINHILKPFKGISSKVAQIQKLLAEKEIYKMFMRHVGDKKYQEALELANKYPTIQELDEYEKIAKIGDIIENRAKEALKHGDYSETVKYAKELMEFPKKKEVAEELIEQATTYMKVLRYFSEKNYKAVYKMVEMHPYLCETEIVSKLEDAWLMVVGRAETFASKGDVAALKNVLANFVSYSHKKSKIVSLFKEAYISQIEQLLRLKSSKYKEAMENYIKIFGEDDEIIALKIGIGMKDIIKENSVPYENIDISSLPDSLV
ncbi:MAG TPA: WD40 repeat domain-containing protein [Campylobacterales bacterium]|nr:WD40 repeat domain-containing protein [Campylobacterales bacterium]